MILGLTGGIGSGKTTVANLFHNVNVPIFASDVEAKLIMRNDDIVISQIKTLLGKESYINGEINTSYISNLVFNNQSLLKQLNSIVHPAVGQVFKDWYFKQNHPYVIKESAILFESGGNLHCDKVLTVTAPLEVRIQRVMARDGCTRLQVESRIKHQISEKFKVENSDFVIVNENLNLTKSQVSKINTELLNKS